MNSHGNSRDTILECALKLFSERGFDAVGVNEIVQAAGVTKPTLYYFFQSKEGVFSAILERYYNLLNSGLRQACAYKPHPKAYYEDVYPVLLRVVRFYFDFALECRPFYLMMLAMSFAPPTAQTTRIAGPYNKEQYGIVIEMFADIALYHNNLKGKERLIARNLISVINVTVAFWYQGYADLDEAAAKDIVHSFMHGIFA